MMKDGSKITLCAMMTVVSGGIIMATGLPLCLCAPMGESIWIACMSGFGSACLISLGLIANKYRKNDYKTNTERKIEDLETRVKALEEKAGILTLINEYIEDTEDD